MNHNQSDSLFVISESASEDLVTSTLVAGPDGDKEIILLFTSRSGARAYLQQAGWLETETPAELQPSAVVRWLLSARNAGVEFVAVDPDYVKQSDGMRQRVFHLEDLLEDDQPTIILRLLEAAQPVPL